MANDKAPLIPLFSLWENTAQKDGSTYFSGYLGKCRVLIFKDKNPLEGQKTWSAFVTEAPPKKRVTPENRPASNGGTAYDDVPF